MTATKMFKPVLVCFGGTAAAVEDFFFDDPPFVLVADTFFGGMVGYYLATRANIALR